MAVATRVLCLLAIGTTVAWGYRMYADRIPNGGQVPHPCKPNALWHGVGHFNVEGGGFRNPFGLDFAQAGKEWTKDLCQKDSDGDGQTNGEELGDPNCVWVVGQIPERTQHLSHPGVCDPIESPSCKNRTYDYGLFHNQEEWMANACKSDEFNCPAILDSDVRTMTTRLDLTPVPAKQTTYICQIFQVPDLQNDYHMIAATPIINNSYILHHMVVFGCEDSVATRSAYECDMLPHPKCFMIMTVWTLGMNGDCFHSNAGFKIGKTGHKILAIQLHWNNPGVIDDYVDSSGLVLHYTPHLRKFDGAVMMLGDEKIIIPPRTPSTFVNSSCPASCTRSKLRGTIYFTAGFNHMHYLGRRMRVDQFRNGTLVKTITNDPIYDYDSPKMYFFKDPLPVEPGDELITMCEYSSTYKTTTTFYGESTSDEMCYAFLSFYPQMNMINKPFCTSDGTFNKCAPETFHGCLNDEMVKYYGDISLLQVYQNVTSSCRPFGPCTSECLDTILLARNSEPCLTSGEPWNMIVQNGLSTYPNGRDFLARLEACEVELQEMLSSQDSN